MEPKGWDSGYDKLPGLIIRRHFRVQGPSLLLLHSELYGAGGCAGLCLMAGVGVGGEQQSPGSSSPSLFKVPGLSVTRWQGSCLNSSLFAY